MIFLTARFDSAPPLALALACSVALAACGASASTSTTRKPSPPSTTATPTSSTTATPTPSTSTPTSSQSAAPARGALVKPLPGPTVSATTRGVHASLHGDSHAPLVGRPWHYSVLATDGSGHALGGSVDTEFVFSGRVVGRETPPTHPLRDGRLNDMVTFPASATAVPELTFRVVVHTGPGSVTLDWPIQVRR